MSLVIPYTFIGGVGNKARAYQVNACFQAMAAKFTEAPGGIGDEDIRSGAGIKGGKILDFSLTQQQVANDAIDSRCLKDDATAGSPNAAVATANHIVDGIITGAKLVPSTITRDRLKVTAVEVAVPSFAMSAITQPWTGISGALVLGVFPVATYDILFAYVRDGAISGGFQNWVTVGMQITQSGGNWVFKAQVAAVMNGAGNFTGTAGVLMIQKS